MREDAPVEPTHFAVEPRDLRKARVVIHVAGTADDAAIGDECEVSPVRVATQRQRDLASVVVQTDAREGQCRAHVADGQLRIPLRLPALQVMQCFGGGAANGFHDEIGVGTRGVTQGV